MVEQWDPVLGPRDPWDPQHLRIPWATWTPWILGPSDPLGSQELSTLRKLPLLIEIDNLNTHKL